MQHTLAQLRILQNIERDKLLRVDSLQAQDLDACAGETALRSLRGPLHEENDGGGGNRLVNRGPRFGGQESGVEDRGELEGRRARRQDV